MTGGRVEAFDTSGNDAYPLQIEAISVDMSTKIILLNFRPKETETIAKAGYSAERGYFGSRSSLIDTPHPLYEYDVMIYNASEYAGLSNEFQDAARLIKQTGSFETLWKFDCPPHVRITFTDGDMESGLMVGAGLRFVRFEPAEKNVSALVETPAGGTFAIPELHKEIVGLKHQVARVGQFYKIAEDPYPFNTFPVLVTRSGRLVAGYGTTYGEMTVPRYVILPQLKDNAGAVVSILQCLEKVWPALFPDKMKFEWIRSEEFRLPSERAIKEEISLRIKEATEIVGRKKEELDRLEEQNSFVRDLLIATEDIKVEVDKRLSGVVRKALEYLEFAVVNIDEKTKSAIKKEDFWVTDSDDFLAITEVSGTQNKNPKTKEFNDILARMATLYKRKGDLVLPKKSDVRGLLVLNYDTETHPQRRPKIYTGEDEHIAETAADQRIGLLSTVELHKIVVAVIEGRISKGDARAILKESGRIEFSNRAAQKA